MAEAHVFRQVEGTVMKTSVPLPEVGPHDVLVRISHSGLCGTDHAYLPYGIALGHEGVGTVERLGSEAKRFHLGDRVGGGFLRNSCGDCRNCLSGREIMCHDRVIFGEADFSNGTIASHYASNENFLYRIPEEISSEHAAPLQCAGATVYMALLKSYKPGDRVGIFGIGGLGHLAIQFASKFGAEVVAFSSRKDKEPEARALGAREFYQQSRLEDLKAPIDVLLVCGGQPDWPAFLRKEVLSRSAIIVPLAAMEKLDLPSVPSTLVPEIG